MSLTLPPGGSRCWIDDIFALDDVGRCGPARPANLAKCLPPQLESAGAVNARQGSGRNALKCVHDTDCLTLVQATRHGD